MVSMIKRVQIVPIGLMLAVLAVPGAAMAQINPATAQNSAQAAAKVAGQSGAQTSNQPAKPAGQIATQTKAAGQSTLTAKSTSVPATKSAGQATSATQTQKPVTQTAATPAPASQKDPKAATKSTTGTTAAATKPAPTKSASANQAPVKQAAAPVKQTSAPAKPAAAKPVTPPANQAKVKQAPGPAKQAGTKSAPAKEEAKPAGKSDATEVKKALPPVSRRDPFVTLIGKQTAGGGGPTVKLPPGKGGLQVGTLTLQGIVSGPNGMIAVVANPQKGVYFLREGDALFDGRVERIHMDAVTFHEVGKDAFGKPLEREVTKKLNPSSGEQP